MANHKQFVFIKPAEVSALTVAAYMKRNGTEVDQKKYQKVIKSENGRKVLEHIHNGDADMHGEKLIPWYAIAQNKKAQTDSNDTIDSADRKRATG